MKGERAGECGIEEEWERKKDKQVTERKRDSDVK